MSDAINPQHYKRLPVEAIEIIESAIEGAPSNRDALLHGQALKYLLRCWNKNGIEDLKKAKWYLDRLIDSFDTDSDSVVEESSKTESKQPTEPTLNIDTIPEGHRKLGDSLIEQRQLGDLRWSIIEERYIPISGDEIGCANRDNWAACRKITTEVAGEVTGEVKPPDGWRFLEVGEVIRKGDRCFTRHSGSIDCLTSVGEKFNREAHYPTIRRNQFEVGERVVNTKIDECIFYKVNKHIDDRLVLCFADRNPFMFSKDELAPYIEDAK